VDRTRDFVNDNNHAALPDGSLLAAVDLGSNSFHLMIARIEHGEIRPTQALSEKVQLAAGLSGNMLQADAMDRGLDCLSRFAQLLQSVEPERIRVVGTSALRRARNRREFTEAARRILGSPVEVIYGREEARLVYLGVAHTLADDSQSRLVVDIGGGSTEFAIGERFEPRNVESLQLGCVTYSRECFDDGVLSKRNYNHAYKRACVEVSHIRKTFRSKHWVEAIGSSGTLQAIEGIIRTQGWDSAITRRGLQRMRKALLRFKRFEDIELEGLNATRRSVIAAGLAITEAVFDVLEIEEMRSSQGALREGVIYDLVGRLRHEDVRERSINALLQRYHADEDTAQLVARRARMLYEATRKPWELAASDGELLAWAAMTHEIGQAISHKHFHRHGAYLLRNSDLPGFAQQEQEDLATLVAGQRGKLRPELFAEVDKSDLPRLQRMTALLRLAALFKYVEQLEQLPDFTIKASAKTLRMLFPPDWLSQHPLTAQELDEQKAVLQTAGHTPADRLSPASASGQLLQRLTQLFSARSRKSVPSKRRMTESARISRSSTPRVRCPTRRVWPLISTVDCPAALKSWRRYISVGTRSRNCFDCCASSGTGCGARPSLSAALRTSRSTVSRSTTSSTIPLGGAVTAGVDVASSSRSAAGVAATATGSSVTAPGGDAVPDESAEVYNACTSALGSAGANPDSGAAGPAPTGGTVAMSAVPRGGGMRAAVPVPAAGCGPAGLLRGSATGAVSGAVAGDAGDGSPRSR
jgi:exopolyphosphatase/guanosine-5'-triphosphate,3'-diphosphate pyrophosphatase